MCKNIPKEVWLRNYDTREGGDFNEPPPDIKTLDIPNICFSLTEKDDKREKEFREQRIERGFDDSETWALDYTIARFILPRLQAYNEVSNVKHGNDFLGKMEVILEALSLVIKDGEGYSLSIREENKIECGMKYFAEIFRELWW